MTAILGRDAVGLRAGPYGQPDFFLLAVRDGRRRATLLTGGRDEDAFAFLSLVACFMLFLSASMMLTIGGSSTGVGVTTCLPCTLASISSRTRSVYASLCSVRSNSSS